MADLKTITFTTAIQHAQEAVRDLPGYRQEDDGIQRRALLNKEKSADNIILILHDCMKVSVGSKNQTVMLNDVYEKKFGKKPKKNTKASILFISLPRTYLPADYKLSDAEYDAVCKEVEQQSDIDPKVLERAHKKLLSRDFTDDEKATIKDFFEHLITAICKVFGIKPDDILYATVHMDESNPHLHMAFLPSKYIQDQKNWQEYQQREVKGKMPRCLLGDLNRIIDPSEKPVGCSVERFGRSFLYNLNQNLSAAMKEQGIDVCFATGKGQINDVQKAPKKMRQYAAITRGVEEESKRRTDEMNKEFEDKLEKSRAILDNQKDKIRKNGDIIAAQKSELDRLSLSISKAKGYLKHLKKAIQDAQAELGGIQHKIENIVSAGIRKIQKAISQKENKKQQNPLLLSNRFSPILFLSFLFPLTMMKMWNTNRMNTRVQRNRRIKTSGET